MHWVEFNFAPVSFSNLYSQKSLIRIGKNVRRKCIEQRRLMYSGSLLSPAMCEIMWSWILCPLPKPFLAQSTIAAFQRDGPDCSIQRRFNCSHIWTWMLDNVRKHLSFTFLLVTFPCGAVLWYFVYLMLIVIILFRLINHKKRIKAFVRIHYSVLATDQNRNDGEKGKADLYI